ncbi:MAG: TetR/AcrR family transcriptional regulator [Caldilineaceae bacterium]
MKIAATPKEKLFETAARLFYQHGYQAVGVDAIAAESGVGKMTLYRHYPSKDDLIVAFLRQSNEDFWAYFEKSIAGAVEPRAQLLSFFQGLQDYVLSPSCCGCPFINVASEYPEAAYAGHQVALEHKLAVRARFNSLAEGAGARQPQELANALLLLMDGAYMAARMYGAVAGSPAATVADAARRLLDTYCAGKENGGEDNKQ